MGATTRWWGGRGRDRGRWRLAVLAVLLVAGLVVSIGPSGPGGPPDAAAAAAVRPEHGGEAAGRGPSGPTGVLAPDGRWTVTLLTGEVVDVWSDAEGRVGAAVREHLGALRSVRAPEGDLYVTPIRVTPLLDRVLDHELFNVTGLIRQGYDDGSSGAVPLIVQHQPGVDARSSLSTLPTAEAGATQPLPSIGAVATEVPKGDARATGELLADLSREVEARSQSVGGITRIWLDRRVTTQSAASAVSTGSTGSTRSTASTGSPRAAASAASAGSVGQAQPPLDGNLTQVGADDAWAAGFTGEGARVAVLDTGIDARHPDLAGRIVAQENFSTSPDTVDRVGHGTHVASIVAGTGSAAEGARRGVAPDAQLLIGKVLGDEGFGSDSEVIAGMEWAAPQADVVNMSLGIDFATDGTDPLSLAVDQLSQQHGALFVVAAGNSGPASHTVGSPGASDRALTVGAVDADDAMADFSSRGPLADSNELKPEVVAPGVDIVAARAAGTAMGEPADADYTAASGTSMATPHVAGAAAVLVQEHPDWGGDQLKAALIGSTDRTGADGFDAGAGRLDVGDAIGTAVLNDRDVVDVALPHPRTEPHTEQITWTNTSDQPQTVALSAELVNRRGDPAGAVSIEPARLTIPAGATGTAAVTVDSAELDAGLYSGTIVADPDGGDGSDDDDVRTPIGVDAEAEMATLTIEATPPADAGDGTPFGGISIINLDDFATYNLVNGSYFGASPSGEVPVGRYAVVGDVTAGDFDSLVVAQVGDPDVTIDGDTTVAFDGSDAVPFAPAVEGVGDATPVATEVGAVITPSAGTGGFGVETSVFSWYPEPPVHVTEMQGDPAHFAVRSPIVRLQAPPITARAAGAAEPIHVGTVDGIGVRMPAPGEHTWRAVDVGDGQDLAPAHGQLAVVRLPADRSERERITQRAEQAGVATLAFVDPSRRVLTLSTINIPAMPWGDVPVVTAAGESATALLDAAATGADVTITVTPSPYVYDLVLPVSDRQDPDPVVDRSEQRRLARLDETFHHDPGAVATGDRRRARSVSMMELDTAGPLPERRTAYVTPEVTWQSYIFGDGLVETPWGLEPALVALSITPETSYGPGSRQALDWLARPLPPGPVGVPRGGNGCQPRPVERSFDSLYVALAAFQDGRDRFTCNAPPESTLTVERDGTVVTTGPGRVATVPVPAERSSYRLTYQQTGGSPYGVASTTTWSFRSAGDGDAGLTRIPLLVVDYGLPLDPLNHLTSRTATFTVRQVTGAESQHVERLRVWTSTDDGTTWTAAQVQRRSGGGGDFGVTLPDVAAGTGVSLRVDARDATGNRVQQTLLDAYTG